MPRRVPSVSIQHFPDQRCDVAKAEPALKAALREFVEACRQDKT
jgi:hypothetical protein